jgi:hypothetical protein
MMTQIKRGSCRAMRCRLSLKGPLTALVAGLLAPALQAAQAGEASFCVTCQGPDQTYLCRVTGEGSSQNDAFKLYCIVRTAKEGHHASCAATSKVEGCAGVTKTYSYNGPSLPEAVAQDPRVQKLMKRVERNQAAFAKPKPRGDEPKTLVELTSRAMSASRQRWRNTFGDAPEPPQSVAPDARTALPPPGQSTASLPPLEANPPPRSTGQRVKQAAQNTGAAVGSAARTTYWCLRSLFFNCGGR